MEYLDPNYKNKKLRLLFLGYVLIGLIITSLAALFVLEARGYYVDDHGDIVQNSLIFIDSKPSNADISVDGVVEDSDTNTRLILPEGQRLIEISKPGYTTWRKQLSLLGGKVVFVKYPFLFPDNLAETVVRSYDTEVGILQSADKSKLLIQPSVGSTVVDFIDLDDKNRSATQLNYAGVFTKPVAFMTLVALSTEDDTSLVKVQTDVEDAVDDYYILNFTTPSDSYQLLLAGRAVQDISLVDGGTKHVYVHFENNELVRMNTITGQQIVLAPNVIAYAAHEGGIVVYAQLLEAASSTKVIISKDLVEHVLVDYGVANVGQPVLRIARYDGSWYYMAGGSELPTMDIYINPLSSLNDQKPPTMVSSLPLTALSSVEFSTNNRFVAGLAGEEFVVYDFEASRTHRYTVSGLAADYEVKWMDGHRLMAVVENQLNIWEFDSQNRITLGNSASSAQVFFDKKFNTMFSARADASGASSIIETSLLVSN